jgi:hypothetical protein
MKWSSAPGNPGTGSETLRTAGGTCPSGSIKGDVKKKHSSSSARRGYFSDIQPPSADARILAEARLGRTDFAGGCGIINCCVPSRGLIAPSSSVLAIANHGSI